MANQFTNAWTDKEINFIKDNITKLTYEEMGRVINRSIPSIQSKVRALPFRKKVSKHPVNSNFFKIWTPEMAYILGFIGADGNICKTGRAHMLYIACDDNDIIVKIKNILEYGGPIHQKVRDNGKISYSLRICDCIIFQDLQRLNITERKSLTFTPPKIPKNLVRHFIRGYFDGDGSVSLRNYDYPSRLVVDIYTASLEMSKFLHLTSRKLLGDLYMGKISIRMAHQKNKYYAIRLGHKASIELFHYMYHNSAIYLERKYEKFMEGLNYGN